MPWTVDDVDKHKKGLSNAQKKQWVKVANATLAACEAKGNDDCEGKAIRIANAAVQEAGRSIRGWLRELVESAQALLTGKADLGEALDLSHDQIRDLLHTALVDTGADDAWIRDVYDAWLVYSDHTGSKHFKRTYMIDNETGAVTLGDAVEVIGQMTWTPVDEAAIIEAECIPLVEKAVREDGTIPVKIIQPGWGTSGYYPPDVLERDGPKTFTKGLHMYWNHPTESEARERPERNLSDLAATLATDAVYRADGPAGPGLYADAQVFGPYREAIDELASHIGVSICAVGRAKTGEAEGRKGPVIEEITAARSVDFVTVPGAGGQVLELFEAAGRKPTPRKESDTVTEQEAQELRNTNAALQAEVTRLKEAIVLREAKSYVDEVLAGIEMPAMTRTRLAQGLAAKPALKEDGTLDRNAYKAQIEEAANAELKYLAEAAGGSGRITGMGPSQTAGDDGQAALVEAFKRAGLSDEQAAFAAAGR